MATKTKKIITPKRSEVLSKEVDAAYAVVREARRVFEAIRNDFMIDFGYCTHCTAKGFGMYRPTIEFMHDLYGEKCRHCDGTGRTDKTGPKCSNLGYKSGEDAPAALELATRFPDGLVREAVAKANVIEAEYNHVLAIERNPPKGTNVIVVKGRKVPVDTTGRVYWSGDSQFGVRVGIETTSGERVFTALDNIDIVW